MDAGMTILIYCVIGAVILFLIVKGFGGSSQPVAPREDKWKPRKIVDGHDYRDGVKAQPVRQAPARGRPTTNEIMAQVSRDVGEIVAEVNASLDRWDVERSQGMAARMESDQRRNDNWNAHRRDPHHFVDPRKAPGEWAEIKPGQYVRDGGDKNVRGWH